MRARGCRCREIGRAGRAVVSRSLVGARIREGRRVRDRAISEGVMAVPERTEEMIDPYCKVFLDGPATVEQAVAVPHGVVGGSAGVGDVKADGVVILVEESDDYSAQGRLVFPTGYFEFRLLVEFLFDEGTPLETAVRYVSSVLEEFWAQGWAAVAACEYDDRLPHRGGFNVRELPWPEAG